MLVVQQPAELDSSASVDAPALADCGVCHTNAGTQPGAQPTFDGHQGC